MTSITDFVSEKASTSTLANAWFGMVIVAIVTLGIGFAAGYSTGFGQAIVQLDQAEDPGQTILVTDGN